MPTAQHTQNHFSSYNSLEEVRYLEQKLERNPNSPIAVRLASHYLKAGRTSEAKALCDRSISLYPDYPTSYLILGKCLLTMGHYTEARNAFRRVLTILPDCLPAQRFLKNLATLDPDELDRQTPVIEPSESRRGGEKLATTDSDQTVGVVEQPAKHPESKTKGETHSTGSTVGPEQSVGRSPGTGLTDFDDLAEKLQHVKRMVPDPSAAAGPKSNFDELSSRADIISETMAEIYASQGAYDEAVRLYRLLIEKKPDHREKFTARIRELQDRK